MEQIIIALAGTLITSIILGWVSAKARKEAKTKSVKKFSVKSPNTYVRVMFFVSLLFLFFAIVLTIISDDIGFLFFLSGASVIVLFLGIVFYLWKLEVNDNELTYRSFIGRRKIADVKDIDRIVETLSNSLIIYVKGRKFGTLNRDMIHIDNFHKYCEKRSIPIQPKFNKPINKSFLGYVAMYMMIRIGTVIGAIALLMFLVLYFIGVSDNYSLGSHLLFGLGFAVLMFAIIVLPASLLPLRGLIYIKMQEKHCGFNFNDEMKKLNIVRHNYMSDDWFISIDKTRIIVFRRDYIKEIGDVTETANSVGVGNVLAQVNISGLDGKKLKVFGSFDSLNKLKKWKQGSTLRDMNGGGCQ